MGRRPPAEDWRESSHNLVLEEAEVVGQKAV